LNLSELHKFLFEGLPVRGMLVRITDGWTEVLRRRAEGSPAGAYPVPVQQLLGEMVAAACLMPFAFGMSSWLYLVCATVLSLGFIAYAVALMREYSDALARKTFRFSLCKNRIRLQCQ
jgi:redox-regulated HSP33 family molecular chaperone